MATNSCCCNILRFGKCFALNHTLIAECTDVLNATQAICYAVHDPFRQFECFIGSCQEEEHNNDLCSPPIPYYFFLWPGIAIFISGLFFYFFVLPKRLLFNYQQKEEYSSATGQDIKEEMTKRPDLRGQVWIPRDVIAVHTSTFVGFCFLLFGCSMRWYTESMVGSVVFLILFLSFEGGRLTFRVALSEKTFVPEPIIEVSNMYLAFEEPMKKVLLVFVCQCLLIWIYIQEIFVDGFLDFSNHMTFLNFFLGIFIQLNYLLLTSDLESYRYFIDFDICWLLGWTLNNSIRNTSTFTISSEGIEARLVSINEIRMRAISSLLLNSLGGLILRPLIPIQLASSESGIEFILNALAAYYIIELDDLPNGRVRKCVIRSQDSAEDEISGLLLSENHADLGSEGFDATETSPDLEMAAEDNCHDLSKEIKNPKHFSLLCASY